ncbi:MAG: NADH-quinone oxidoreductase subunit C [Actinomyces sp.]|nr:MAG: NADH-quinone oxidoreductase subunit C [Actinomyces sp.]
MSPLSSPDTPTDVDEPAEAPDEVREALLARLTDELGDALAGHHLRPGDDLWIRVRREAWLDTARLLRDGLGFGFFDFLSGIDWMPSPFGRSLDSAVDAALGTADATDEGGDEASEAVATGANGHAGGETRFQVFARVRDVVSHRAVTCKVDIPDDDLSVDSWIPVYPGANWHERECWEMYGITFTGHPDLRHIYLPSEFEGHPLRKDYPLVARLVKPWPGIVDVEAMPGEEESS